MSRKHRSVSWAEVAAALDRMLTDTLPVEPGWNDVLQADLTRQMERDRKRWPDLYRHLEQEKGDGFPPLPGDEWKR